MPQILDGDLIFWVRSPTEPIPDILGKQGTENIEALLRDRKDPFAKPIDLRSVFDFSLAAKRIKANEDAAVVVAPEEINVITTAALLVGTSMITVHGVRPDQLMDKLGAIAHQVTAFDDITMEDCFNAVYHAKQLGWLSLDIPDDAWEQPTDKPLPLDILEYLHYDDPANGNFHFVIRDRLLLFHEPKYSADGSTWQDVDGVRYFSADYYADLFGDFGVSLVVRVGASGGASAYDASAFTARGIAVEDLPLGEAGAAGALPVPAVFGLPDDG